MRNLLVFVLWIGLGISVSAQSAPVKRDPFWPIDYHPEKAVTQGTPDAPETPHTVPNAPQTETTPLTDDELRQLALDESERIRQTLRRQATMTTGNRIYAYVQNKWVTAGDTLTVEVQGNTYRLEILHLTSDNIELEAHPTQR